MDRIQKIKAFPEGLDLVSHIVFNILQEYELILTFVFEHSI